MNDKHVILEKYPLVVDLDGTLTPTDTLVESVIQLIKQSPLNFFLVLLCLIRGRAAFKTFVVKNVNFLADNLPYQESLLSYLRREKSQGRRLILATASHKIIALKISEHIGIFDDVVATDNKTNLKGKTKLDAIRKVVGDDFVYAGDSAVDIPIWKNAKAAILVNASSSTSKVVRKVTIIEKEFPCKKVNLLTWVKVLRIHQWLKNLLIFVPILTAFSFLILDKVLVSVMAFLAFSLTASSTYIVNDLWDLDSDRTHPRKRLRPLANAEVSIVKAVLVSVVFLSAGMYLAWIISEYFFFIMLLYLLITSSYSWFLKQYVLIDVIVLALLYTIRIFAGSVAIGVITSTWLLAFSVFLFLSLALVKRCAELVSLKASGGRDTTSGRDYRVSDLIVLWPLGIGAAVSAVVIFGLFISSPETALRYGTPQILWLIALCLVYWLSRMWIKTARGEMLDDPVVYAVKDKGSLILIIVMAVTMTTSYYINVGNLI